MAKAQLYIFVAEIEAESMKIIKEIAKNKWSIMGYVYMASITIMLFAKQLNYLHTLSSAQVTQSSIYLAGCIVLLLGVLLPTRYCLNIVDKGFSMINTVVPLFSLGLLWFVSRYTRWDFLIPGPNIWGFVVAMLFASAVTYYLVTLKPLLDATGEA